MSCHSALAEGCDRDNIRDDELVALKRLAGELLNYDDAALAKAIAAGVLSEVTR
jgi:hypothetical protein